MSHSRIQSRAICPVCGKEHAVNEHGRLAAHGYTRKWGFDTDHCPGSHLPHAGHKDVFEALAGLVGRYAQAIHANKHLLAMSESKLAETEKATEEYREISRHITQVKARIEAIPAFIRQLTETMINWTEAQPREVDLLVEETEARRAREPAAKVAKAEREAKAAAKKQAAADREAKAAAKEAKMLEESKEGFLCVKYEGQIVIDKPVSEMGLPGKEGFEREFRREVERLQRAHLAEHCEAYNPDDWNQYTWQLSGSVIVTEIRTAAGGKGRRIQTNKH